MTTRITLELSTDSDYVPDHFRFMDQLGRWVDATVIDRNPVPVRRVKVDCEIHMEPLDIEDDDD